MYKYKFETKELEKSNILTKTEKTIVNIAQEIEDYKYKIGKTKANSYITNIATLERIKKYGRIPLFPTKRFRILSMRRSRRYEK